jgi:hypothetical protein
VHIVVLNKCGVMADAAIDKIVADLSRLMMIPA